MNERAITIRQARTNNLAGIDLDVPRNQLVVFVGRSGSGKSSLVFDTIAAEAGFQLNETFPPFARNRLPKWARPEVEHIDGLTPVIVIDQRRIGGNARSTVGTVTDAWTYLRLLFSRLSEPVVGESNRFSFNDPSGMCPQCSGLGEVVVSAVDRFLDLDKSLAEGAIQLPGFGPGKYWYAQYADIGSFDVDSPLREWSAGEREALLYGGRAAAELGRKPPKEYEGVVERFERVYLHTADNLSERKQETIRRFTRSDTCPECGGDRLAKDARTATVRGRTIGELARWEITELLEFVREIEEPAVAPVVSALVARLQAMVTIGLGYLALARATTSLSGGESQRIKTVKQLGSSLTELTYVVDEPTVGLHPTDVESMIALLEQLRDSGNSVLVVEHDPAVMQHADQIVEIGPGAGAEGGRLVFQGSYDELCAADTPTGRALRRVSTASPAEGKGESRRSESEGGEGEAESFKGGREVGSPDGREAKSSGVQSPGGQELESPGDESLGGQDVEQSRAEAWRAPQRDGAQTGASALVVAHATRNNLRDVTVRIPRGVMTVLTGVAGSGKSSLAAELVAQHAAVVIDQKAVGTSRRSTPITYTGIAPAIRRLFARRNDVPVAMFSANSAGACVECRGLGVLHTDLAFLEGQEVVCPACGGRRFSPESLTYLVNGYSIADVDDLTIEQAIVVLPEAGIARGLEQLTAVGLGYLRLGQSLNTLSGGECQRVKIAKELRVAEERTTYVLDEPTTGLHLDDIATLQGVLDRLVERGHSVVVVEHNLEVIRRADWLIDLGPGPGRHGGTVLFEGRPGDYSGRETPTSRALAVPVG